MKLNIGIVQKKKAIKAVSILKEDKQAFGLIVTKLSPWKKNSHTSFKSYTRRIFETIS